MIARHQLTAIGAFLKPHGVKGELNAVLDCDSEALDSLRCLFIEIEGLIVPFFIASHRSRGSHAELITLADIDSEPKAKPFAGKEIFALSSELSENSVFSEGSEDSEGSEGSEDSEGFYLSDLEGYAVVADGTPIGEVTGFDDSTANVLMFVEDADGRRRAIPVADEFFETVDPDTKTIHLTLPQGILEL